MAKTIAGQVEIDLTGRARFVGEADETELDEDMQRRLEELGYIERDEGEDE